MGPIWLIFIGGGLGAVLRYLLAGWVQQASGSVFPFGTLVVNVSGCFLIGLVGGLLLGLRPLPEEYRLALLSGLLGGYTTFSTFSLETFQLAENHGYFYAGLNIVLSVTGGLIAVWMGRQMAGPI